MKVLIACEESGMVRRAFAALGHEVYSSDLKPARDGSNMHLRGDVREFIGPEWNWDLLMVAHPPCTRLCNSGVRWLFEPPTKLNPEHHTREECAAYLEMNREERLAFIWAALDAGAAFFSDLWNAIHIPRRAIENPVMHSHAKQRIRNYREPAQTVQPWMFGDRAFKATSWWLEGLPLLQEGADSLRSEIPKAGTPEHKAWSAIHLAPPGKLRSEIRSAFFPGMSRACAETWGGESFIQSLQAA